MYATSVILLQSKEARKDMRTMGGDWRDRFEARTRAAFQSGHEIETSDRKRQADDGSGSGTIGINEDKTEERRVHVPADKRIKKKKTTKKKKAKKKSRKSLPY